MKVSKQTLIDWATNIKTDSVDFEVDENSMIGGGSFDRPDGSPGWCCGYTVKIAVAEDAPDGEKGGLDFIKPTIEPKPIPPQAKCNRCGAHGSPELIGQRCGASGFCDGIFVADYGPMMFDVTLKCQHGVRTCDLCPACG